MQTPEFYLLPKIHKANGSRNNAPGKKVPQKKASRKLPPAKLPPGNITPGKFSSRKLPPRIYTPIKIASRCPEKCPREKSLLEKIPLENCRPGKYPPEI